MIWRENAYNALRPKILAKGSVVLPSPCFSIRKDSKVLLQL